MKFYSQSIVRNAFLLCACLVSVLTVTAENTFDKANEAYAEGNYEKAIELYQSIIDTKHPQSESKSGKATIYYNLGNAQFKQGNLAQAILGYERALRLNPNYTNAQYNLEFAQTQITDAIKNQDFFLSKWIRTIRDNNSRYGWLFISLGLFMASLVGIITFLLGQSITMRKVAFHIAWIALIISIYSGINSYSLYQRDTYRREAIITQGIVNAKSSPDRSGTDLFTIHEGTKVIIQETIGEWANIRVAQHEGWIQLRNLERI